MNGRIESTLPKTVDISDFEVKMIVASKLYELGKLSSGQAAELAGLSKRAFLELLGKYNVSVFGYDENELAEDLKTYAELNEGISL
jgi:predicted HTH domain antitoxin